MTAWVDVVDVNGGRRRLGFNVSEVNGGYGRTVVSKHAKVPHHSSKHGHHGNPATVRACDHREHVCCHRDSTQHVGSSWRTHGDDWVGVIAGFRVDPTQTVVTQTVR